MNNNLNEAEAIHIEFADVLIELQRVESLHALIVADDCHGFLSMSEPQQKDVLFIASAMTLEARCLLADEIKK